MSSQATAAPNANRLKEVVSPRDATLDIVAVHGMNLENKPGHAENAWTDRESGTNWLRDLLPSKIPYARILAYCYNANVAFGASSAGIQEQAKNMLLCLSSARESDSVRPIIFIAHSMGGIVVKEALATAYHGDKVFAALWTMTYGIAFFGVPHYGSRYASWGRIVAQIVGVATGQVNNSFLGSVEARSAYNDMLNDRFRPLLEAYRFITICETVPERIGSVTFDRIVYDDSAILNLPDEQEVKYWPNRTHRTLCKFSSDDPEWNHISEVLSHAAGLAVQSLSYSPNIVTRREVFNHSLWNSEASVEVLASLPDAIEQAQTCHERIRTSFAGSGQINDLEIEVNTLNSNIRGLAIGLWIILLPFLPVIGALMLLPAIFTFLLPSEETRATVTESAERAGNDQQRVVEIERQVIELLESHRHEALESIGMLRNSFRASSLPSTPSPSATELALARHLHQELQRQVVRIIQGISQHENSYNEANRSLSLIEEGRREIEGRDDREFWIYIAERAQEEKERRKNDGQEQGGSICGCIIL